MRLLPFHTPWHKGQKEKVLMGTWLLFVAMIGAAGFSLYMALLCWRAGDNSAWFFIAVGVFFLIPVTARLVSPAAGKINSSPDRTRFVPHWCIMGVAITLGLCMLVTILLRLLL